MLAAFGGMLILLFCLQNRAKPQPAVEELARPGEDEAEHIAGNAVPWQTFLERETRVETAADLKVPQGVPADAVMLRVRSGPVETPLGLAPLSAWGESPSRTGSLRTIEGRSWLVRADGAIPAAPAENGWQIARLAEAGRYAVVALDPAWTPAPPVWLRWRPGQGQELLVDLAPTADLRVRVVDDASRPLPNAFVHVRRACLGTKGQFSAEHVATEHTGPDGIAVIPGLDSNVQYDILAGGILGFRSGEARGRFAGPHTVVIQLESCLDSRIRVVDLISGRPISGAQILVCDTDYVTFSGDAGGNLETVGYGMILGITDAFGSASVKSFAHNNLLVEAPGYGRRALCAARMSESETVALVPFDTGAAAGQVFDLQGRPIPDCAVSFTATRKDGTVQHSGTVSTDPDGWYRIPELDVDEVGSDPCGVWNLHLVATHERHGVDEQYTNVPTALECVAQMDLVLYPHRLLRVQLLPAGGLGAGATLTLVSAPDRRLRYGHGYYAWSDQTSALADDTGLAVFEAAPAEGPAWLVVSAAHGKGGALAVIGPLRLEAVVDELRVHLPGPQDLGTVSLSFDTGRRHRVRLYRGRGHALQDPIHSLDAANYWVDGLGAQVIPDLLPGDYTMTVDGKPAELATFTVVPGSVTALGRVPVR